MESETGQGTLLTDYITILNRVRAHWISPSHLASTAKSLLELPTSLRGIQKLRQIYIDALQGSPFLENRSELLSHLLTTSNDSAEERPQANVVFASHAGGIDALRQQQQPSERDVFKIINTRYPSALFVSPEDLAAAMSLYDSDGSEEDSLKWKSRLVLHYLRTLPHHVVRAQTRWERKALLQRGSSYNAVRLAAYSALQTVEDLLKSEYPKILDSAWMHYYFLNAAAIIGASDLAQHHWSWLVSKKRANPDSLQAATRAAENVDTLRWAIDQLHISPSGHWLRPDDRVRLLAVNMVRLGLLDGAKSIVERRPSAKDWSIDAHNAPLDSAEGALDLKHMKYLYNFWVLKRNGLDFATIEWLLSTYTPHYRTMGMRFKWDIFAQQENVKNLKRSHNVSSWLAQ